MEIHRIHPDRCYRSNRIDTNRALTRQARVPNHTITKPASESRSQSTQGLGKPTNLLRDWATAFNAARRAFRIWDAFAFVPKIDRARAMPAINQRPRNRRHPTTPTASTPEDDTDPPPQTHPQQTPSQNSNHARRLVPRPRRAGRPRLRVPPRRAPRRPLR